MKPALILFTVLFLSLPLFSQRNAEAVAIMDKAFAGFEKSQGIELLFETTTIDADGDTYPPEKGKAYIKGNRFKLEMEDMNIWFDGETQWVFMKDANEVNISKPNSQEIATISPLALLGMYKNGYTLKAPVSKVLNQIPVYQIEMQPTSGNKDLKVVIASINKNFHTLVQVVLTAVNGMKTQINISHYNANYQFDDTFFRFNKTVHPGVEIVDLR